MTEQYIRMQFYHNDGFTFTPTSAYEIKFKGRWEWLQKLCWRFLQKTKCIHPHFDKEQLIKQVVIDKDKATLEIIRLASKQLELMSGDKPTRILVGKEQFRNLVDDIDMRRSFQFDIQLSRSRSQPSDPWDRFPTKLEVFSVPVQIVPWMDGVLVL